jgi:hypothetical protein
MFSYTKLMQAMSGAAAAAADAFFNRVTLLLNTSSTNGAQNNTFLDSSTNNFTITRNGNTTQGTFTPFSQAPGYWGVNFNNPAATGEGHTYTSFLNGTSSAANLSGATAWTIEAWVYPIRITGGLTANEQLPIIQWFSNTTTRWGIGLTLSSGIFVPIMYHDDSGVTPSLVGSTSKPVPINAWTHIAVSLSGGTNRIFVNGELSASTSSYTYPYNVAAFWIGKNRYDAFGNVDLGGFDGYISNLRVVNGTAVYTSDFTPQTTPLTAITNTALLTCQSNLVVDNSTNNTSITVNGTTTIQAFSPFLPTAAYSTSVVGGSGYFDGTGDYLNGPNASGGDFSSGNFTISCWFYPTTLTSGTDYGLMAYADTGGWNGWQLQASGTNKNIKFEFLTASAGASTITGGSIVLNAWNYVVVTRSGSTVNMYVNSTSVAATTTNSTAYGVAGSRILVGVDRLSSSAFIGYISNSKLVKQANAPASIPTAPDTNTTNTSLLLNFTNAGIFDSAAKNVLETLGNASVSTTQAKWGTTSMAFDGTGDYLSATPKIQSNAVQGGNATIEMWVYTSNSSSSLKCLVDTRSAQNTDTGFGIYQIANNVVIYGAGVKGNAASQLTGNTWVHLAVTRANTTNYVFIGGTLYNTFSYGNTLTSSNVTIASDVAGSNAFTGYIDDLRITNGVARYTANFVPTTTAFPLQ